MSDLTRRNGPLLDGVLDLNFSDNGEDKSEDYVGQNLTSNDGIQVDMNQQMQQDPNLQPADSRFEKLGSDDKHCGVPNEFHHDDVRRRKCTYEQEATRYSSKDNLKNSEMDEVNGNYIQESTFQIEPQTTQIASGNEENAHLQEFPRKADANQVREMEGDLFDDPNAASHDAKEKLIFLQKSYEHKQGRKNDSYCYSSDSLADCEKEDMAPNDPHSSGSGPQTSPVINKKISVSTERSPCTLQSTNAHKPQSPLSSRHIHPSSPDRSKLVEGISSEEQLFSSRRLAPDSPQRSSQRSHHKDGSSPKLTSLSPKMAPEVCQRRDRLISQSPTRRTESSSRYNRDYHARSRSRSPYSRYHHRSPRRRYSPRRRSSPPRYHSHHRSPRRRPWSPPPNRKTGLGKPGNNLFVAGFSFLTTERDLQRKFSRFGRVRDVHIVRDNRSGDSRGFGFLSLERDEEADAAIRALDETEWDGRIILVEKSKSTNR